MLKNKVAYEYTAVDRTVTPHHYMYTKFVGNEFLQAYLEDRLNLLKHSLTLGNKKNVHEIDDYFCEALDCFINAKEMPEFNFYHKIQSIKNFSNTNEVDTLNLLVSLIYYLLFHKVNNNEKEWINFLIQRFEVTKKMYEYYHFNKLRKGKGDSSSPRIYWLFSVLLVLAYFKTNNLKYLNTLLKVNDLICSLNDSKLLFIPSEGIHTIIVNEIAFIKNLSSSVEKASFDFK